MRADEQTLELYHPLLTENLKEVLKHCGAMETRAGIFSSVVTVWLMILQRLNPDHSLAAALCVLRAGRLDPLLGAGIRGESASPATGGYSRARKRLSVEAVLAAFRCISSALEATHDEQGYKGRKLFVIDGSTLRIEHTSENLRKYPCYKNQHGEAHYPLVSFGIATNAITGVAAALSYGPYSGAEPTNELLLAEEIMPQIPKESVVIGDRFYGCARFASCAQTQGLDVICRLKERDAKRYIGTPDNTSGEIFTTWQSLKSRTGKQYSVSGRFIWYELKKKGFRPQRLILFTTLDFPPKEIVELYGKRWNVELDLRDIKTTLDLEMIHAKSPEMVAKELILGIAAFNLVRHLMLAPAKQLRVKPRDLSFALMLKRIRAQASTVEQLSETCFQIPLLAVLFTSMNALKHPKRNAPRPTEPRKKWRYGETRYMTNSREEERKKIMKNRLLDS